MNQQQGTVQSHVQFSGKGLHTGRLVTLDIYPAPEDFGIVFHRVDQDQARPVLAHVSNVSATALSTTIGTGPSSVSTIEHLMAAFAGLGIDNALVKINAPELPIMDGSSAEFVRSLLSIGIARQSRARRTFFAKRSFEVRDGDRWIKMEPAESLSFNCTIDYGRSVIGRQSLVSELGLYDFLRLVDARTFCHIDDIRAMRESGLALGGSLDNAVVVSDEAVMNKDGLRGANEFVRHKLLDCVGDLALLGGALVAKISLHKAGHQLHVKFLNEILQHKSNLLSVVESASFSGSERCDLVLMPAAVYG